MDEERFDLPREPDSHEKRQPRRTPKVRSEKRPGPRSLPGAKYAIYKKTETTAFFSVGQGESLQDGTDNSHVQIPRDREKISHPVRPFKQLSSTTPSVSGSADTQPEPEELDPPSPMQHKEFYQEAKLCTSQDPHTDSSACLLAGSDIRFPTAGNIVRPESFQSMQSHATQPQASQTQQPQAGQSTQPQASQTQQPQANQSTQPQAGQTQQPQASQSTQPHVSQTQQPQAGQSTQPHAGETQQPHAGQSTQTGPTSEQGRNRSTAQETSQRQSSNSGSSVEESIRHNTSFASSAGGSTTKVNTTCDMTVKQQFDNDGKLCQLTVTTTSTPNQSWPAEIVPVVVFAFIITVTVTVVLVSRRHNYR